MLPSDSTRSPVRPARRTTLTITGSDSSSSRPAATGSTPTGPADDKRDDDGEGIADRSLPDALLAGLGFSPSSSLEPTALSTGAALLPRHPVAALVSGSKALGSDGMLRPRVPGSNGIASPTCVGGESSRSARDAVMLSDGLDTIRAVSERIADPSSARVDGAVASLPATEPATIAASRSPAYLFNHNQLSSSSSSTLKPTLLTVPPPSKGLLRLNGFDLERRPAEGGTSNGDDANDDTLLVLRSCGSIDGQLTEAEKQSCIDEDSRDGTFTLTPSPRSSSETNGAGLPRNQLASAAEIRLSLSASSLTLRPATGVPRLPVELQAMILKETLALYRADDRRARDAEKARAASAGRPSLAASTTALVGSSRWSLLFVCRDWHALAEPELYKTVSLSSSRSYMLLGRALSSPSGQLAECDWARRLRRWIKRAVLRNVPSHVWREPSSGWGRVLGGLRDLDSLKVRFADSAEGRLAGLPVRRSAVGALADDLAPPDGASDGSDSVGPAGEVEGAAPAEIQMEPSVWATYPNLNPRIYHQHHLSTLALPFVAQAWPRFRVTSSELVFCLTHPPPTSAVLQLPLKSHHVTIFLAGDMERTDRFARFLSRLAHGPALGDLRCAIRCPTEHAALAVLRAVSGRPELGARLRARAGWRIEVGWPVPGERHTWSTRQFGATPTTTQTLATASSMAEESGPQGSQAISVEAVAVPAWASQHGGLVLGPGGGGVGVAAFPSDDAGGAGPDLMEGIVA